MKQLNLLLPFLFVLYLTSCQTKKTTSLEENIQTQLAAINSLLRSDSFSAHIARAQDTAYYKGVGEPVPTFLAPGQDTAVFIQPLMEEKVATNLAGFYALECAVAVLCQRTKEKPTDWLQKIVTEKADSGSILLLNRFANATWKTGQPFRGLERITRPTFTVASFLPAHEIAKDYYQVKTAASKLLSALQPVEDSSLNAQMLLLRKLLHSQLYAYEMAAFMDSGYYAGQREAVPGFRTSKEDSGFVRRPVLQQKIASNLAGFYALECGLNYLVTTKHQEPKNILASITANTISAEDKELLSRFANATWKASQPFRGLARIERDTFTPFYFLNDADIEKDWVQIESAAATVLQAL